MRSGFTKVEALVVLLIFVGIGLASWWSYQTALLKSNDVRRKNDVKHVAEAVEIFASDYGEFPGEHLGRIQSCGAPKYEDPCDWGIGSFGEPEGTIYMHRVPADPTPNGRQYLYVVNKERTEFWVYAALEYLLDEDRVVDDKFPMCGKTKCNFVVNRKLRKQITEVGSN